MLGVRLDDDLERRLAAVARSQGRSKSDIARDVVRRYVDLHDEVLKAEARRQSLIAAKLDGPEDFKFFEAIEAEDGEWK